MNDVRNQNAETDGALHAHGETFGKVFDSLMHNLTLTDGAIRLYAHMHWRYGSNHRNFEGQRNIAEMLGVNDRTIRIRLSELEACGWVVSVPRYGKDGSRLSNFYHIFESTAEGLQWRTEQNIQPREIVDTRKARKGIGGLPTHRNLSTGGVSESKYLSPWNLSTDSYPDSGDLDSHLYAPPDDLGTTLCAADAAPGHFNTENTPAERETHELPTALNAVMEKANGSENDRATRNGSDAVDKDPPLSIPRGFPLPSLSKSSTQEEMVIELWNTNARYTVFTTIGDTIVAADGYAGCASRQNEKQSELPEIISHCLANTVKKLLTNTPKKFQPGMFISTSFAAPAAAQSSEQRLPAPLNIFAGEYSFSMRRQENPQAILAGTVTLADSTAKNTLSLKLTASCPDRQAVSTWLGICKSFAPIATSAKAKKLTIGADGLSVDLPPSPAARKPKTPKVAQPLQYGDVFAALLETAFGALPQMVKTGVSSPVPKSTKDRCGKVAKALLRDFPDATEADVRTFAADWLATHKNISFPLGEDTYPDHFGRWRSWKAKRAVTTDRVPHPLFPNSGATCSVAEARAYENEAAR